MPTTSLINKLERLPPGLLRGIERLLKSIPAVRRKMDSEYDAILQEMEHELKPYRTDFPTFADIPEQGRGHNEILQDMEAMHAKEQERWRNGFVSGAVYHGDAEHIEFLNRVYALNSQSNPLHSDLWPSASKYEAEVVAMTAGMLGGKSHPAGGESDPGKTGGGWRNRRRAKLRSGGEICGTVSSGGTESILLAMKTYRDWARDKLGIRRPEMVVPLTAHAAFDKAAQYFNIRLKRIPVDSDFKADISAARKAITRNTIVIVGSTPSFPHGAIDPIEVLSELALERGIGFHTDACLGGFVLPWARKLGYDVPPFDFSLRGVTSMSADTHKYGYAAKGSSVVLYRGQELRHYQYYTATEWPGGLYFSPTFAGSRPGALSATCWAAMVATGEQGYLQATRKILETADFIKQEVAGIAGLRILGKPLWVIAFASEGLDIYRIMDFMTKRSWSLNGLHKPACVHLCVTLRHTQPGIAQKFVGDLREAVAYVRAKPAESGGMAPVYGMAATIPLRGVVSELLKKYMDILFKV